MHHFIFHIASGGNFFEKTNFLDFKRQSERSNICDIFLESYEGLKIAILVNLGKLTRDIFRTINA